VIHRDPTSGGSAVVTDRRPIAAGLRNWMRTYLRFGALALCSLYAIPSVAQSPTVSVPYRFTCAQCTVEFTKVHSFGSASDPVPTSNRAPLVRDSKGRYFALGYDRLQIVVFDSDGKYLTAFGRRGQGPGEFGNLAITAIGIGRSDSIFVFQEPAAVSVFAPNLQFARLIHMPSGLRVAASPMSNGKVLVSARYLTQAQVGLPFHILNENGTVFKSFGSVPVSLLPTTAAPYPTEFLLAPDERSLWTAAWEGYHLEQWNLDGTLSAVFEVVDIPWAHPTTYRETIGRDGRPTRIPNQNDAISLAGIDGAGLLWINVFHPGSPAGGANRDSHVLEVFDTKSGKFLLSQPVEAGIRRLSDDLFYTSSVDADGTAVFTILRAHIRRPRGSDLFEPTPRPGQLEAVHFTVSNRISNTIVLFGGTLGGDP
jgi:hypothetical protein